MARKKLSPLVQAMTLYAELDERDKQTLADFIKSQTTRPKSTSSGAPSVGKRSSRKNSTTASSLNSVEDEGNVSSASVA